MKGKLYLLAICVFILPSLVLVSCGKSASTTSSNLTNTSSSVSSTTSSSPSVATTITVGSNPTSIAYDSGKGEIFVTDQDSGSVAIMSDSTNDVLSTLTVGPLLCV